MLSCDIWSQIINVNNFYTVIIFYTAEHKFCLSSAVHLRFVPTQRGMNLYAAVSHRCVIFHPHTSTAFFSFFFSFFFLSTLPVDCSGRDCAAPLLLCWTFSSWMLLCSEVRTLHLAVFQMFSFFNIFFHSEIAVVVMCKAFQTLS